MAEPKPISTAEGMEGPAPVSRDGGRAASAAVSAAERRRKERRYWRAGLLLSLLIHILIFVFWPVQTILLSPFAAAGPHANDPNAASGAMQALNVTVQRPVPVVRPPLPVSVEVSIEPIRFEDEPTIEVASSGLGRGDQGPGTTVGAGSGDGGTGDTGISRTLPPTPRGMILPPSNQRLRGTEVEVWVFVDERGRVVADSTRLRPPTRDGGFNTLLLREAAEWVFHPATRGGQPVATWFPYKILM